MNTTNPNSSCLRQVVRCCTVLETPDPILTGTKIKKVKDVNGLMTLLSSHQADVRIYFCYIA